MVFGGRTRTAATARPRRPSDGKNRWVTETDAELYGRPILTEFNGLISSTKGQVVRRLACEAHVDAQRGHNTRCVGRVSVASVGLEKVRLSGREHLAGVRWEIKTHCVGQVKTER